MLKGKKPSNKFIGRIGLFFVITAFGLTIAAAGTNAAGFSFVDSVKEFLGFAPTTQTSAPVTQTAEPNSAQPMAPLSAFTAGNVVVCRMGTGSAVLSNAATAVFLDEYTPAGSLVQSIAMPTADAGANQMLTASGTAANECGLTRSSDGQYLIITGYDAATGTAGIATSSSATFPRVIGRVNSAGVSDTSTTTTSFNAGGIRSARSAAIAPVSRIAPGCGTRHLLRQASPRSPNAPMR